jgi:hypothetical protein
MSRPKKECKRINMKLAADAAELLEQYCKINRFDATFAIESLLRLHVPILLERKKAAAKKSS